MATSPTTPRHCPSCGGPRVASILYGLVDIENAELARELDGDRIVLGGCCAMAGGPEWECLDCGRRWGRLHGDLDKDDMAFGDLCARLPNGLHDAEVENLRIDYVGREVVLDLNVWIGDVSSDDEDAREAYRPAALTLSGLLFCCIEPPSPQYPFGAAGAVTIDAGTVEDLSEPPAAPLPVDLPADSFTCWFFVRQWNASIYIAATRARLAWREAGSPS